MSRPSLAANGCPLESVWDYPRPPAVVPCARRVRVIHDGIVIAESERAVRVLETASPPTVYVPPEDVDTELLEPTPGHTVCEWKGSASYVDLVGGDAVAARAGWFYPSPSPRFAALVDHVALYPGAMDRCLVDGEQVIAQPGGFYGGWITSAVSGPFKGIPGSQGW